MKSYAVIVGVALLMVACVSAHVIVTKFHNPLCIGRGESITYLQDETADTTCAPYYDGALGPAPAPAKRTDPVLGFLEATRCELGHNYSFALSEDAACTVLGDEFLVGLPETCNLVTSEIEWTHGARAKRVVKTRPARWECDKRWDCPELEGDSMTVFCHDGHPMFHDWIEIEVCSASTTPTSPPHVSPPPPHVSPPPPTAVPTSPPHVSPPPPHVSPPPPHVSPPPPTTVPVGTVPLPLLEPTLEPLEVPPLMPLKRWDTCDCSGKLTQIKTWLDVEGCQRVYTTGNVLARRGALWATGDWVLVPADHSCPADEGAYTVSFYADANCSTPTSGYHTIAGACALNGDLNVNMYCSGRTIHVSPPPPHVSPPPPHVSPPPPHVSPPPPHVSPPPPHVSPPPPTTVPTSPPHVSPPPPHVSPPPPHVSPPPPHVSPPPSVVVLPPDGSAAEPGVATPTSNAPLASAPASSAPQQSLVFSVVVLAFSLPLLISLF